MKYWAIDLLRCPACKHHPLRLIVFREEELEAPIIRYEKPVCRKYCGYLDKPIKQGETYPCEKCLRREIVEGIVYCPVCLHWYPIRNKILVLMPDKKRNREKDIEFLKQHRDKIPKEILEQGKPYNLVEENAEKK